MNNLIRCIAITCSIFIISSCNTDEDPLALPEGVQDCNAAAMQSDQNQRVGNFSVDVDGVTTVGVARVLFQSPEDSSAGFIFEIFREDCFGLAKIIFNATNTYNDNPINSNYESSNCDSSTPDIYNQNYFNYTILDDHIPIASYNALIENPEASFRITEVNLEDGYLKGNFGGTLYLDTLCISYQGYPSSLSLENGKFIASIFKSR